MHSRAPVKGVRNGTSGHCATAARPYRLSPKVDPTVVQPTPPSHPASPERVLWLTVLSARHRSSKGACPLPLTLHFAVRHSFSSCMPQAAAIKERCCEAGKVRGQLKQCILLSLSSAGQCALSLMTDLGMTPTESASSSQERHFSLTTMSTTFCSSLKNRSTGQRAREHKRSLLQKTPIFWHSHRRHFLLDNRRVHKCSSSARKFSRYN